MLVKPCESCVRALVELQDVGDKVELPPAVSARRPNCATWPQISTASSGKRNINYDRKVTKLTRLTMYFTIFY